MKKLIRFSMAAALFLALSCTKDPAPCQAYKTQAEYYQAQADSVYNSWGAEAESILARVRSLEPQRNFYDHYQAQAKYYLEAYNNCN